MVLENETGRTRPEERIPATERRQSEPEITLNIGFRHNPGLDKATPHIPDEAGSIRETNSQALGAALTNQLGLSAGGAGIVTQSLRSEQADKPVSEGAYTKGEVAGLLRRCAEMLEEVEFVAGVIRETGVSFEYVESARKSLSERGHQLELVARAEALGALETSLGKHKIFEGNAASRVIEAIDRDMRYGSSRGAICFRPDDAVLLADLLESHTGLDSRRVREIVKTVLREGIGKAEPGDTQRLIRDTLERSEGADPAAVKSLVRLWLSKSDQFDRYDVATMLFLVSERGSELAGAGERAAQPLYSGQKALRMGPLLDVGSLAGLDPAAEKIAKELVGTASLVEKKEKVLSAHLLTNLGLEEWYAAIEEFRRQGTAPIKPGGMTTEGVDIRKALEIGLSLLGASDARITVRKEPNGLSSKWRVQYGEI